MTVMDMRMRMSAYTLETYMWNQSEQILRDSRAGKWFMFLLMAKSQSDRVEKL